MSSARGRWILAATVLGTSVAWLDATIVTTWASYMQWLGRPMLFNGSDWGFATHTFDEIEIDASDRFLA